MKTDTQNFTRYFLLAIVMAFSVLFLASCQEDPTASNNNNTTTNEVTTLQGTWMNGCHSFDAGGVIGFVYRKQTLLAYAPLDTGNTNTEVLYSDIVCTTPIAQVVYAYSYTLGASGVTPGGKDYTELNLTFGITQFTPIDATLVANMNAANAGAGYCAINTWTANIPQDVPACTDLGTPPDNTAVYQIVSIATYVTPNVLNLGDDTGTNDGSSAALRPIEIMSGGNSDYVKQ